MERMNRELTEELRITKAYIPTRDFSEIEWASYVIRLHTNGGSEQMAEEIRMALRTSPMTVIKKGKAGEKEIDLIPMIAESEVKWDEAEGDVVIRATLKASSTEFLNPELLITGLRNACGILCGSLKEEWYSILRTGVYKQDMTLFQ